MVNMRYLATRSGAVHVITTQLGSGRCPVVQRGINDGSWKGRRSLKPEDVLKMKDCARCGTHDLAKSEIKRAEATAKTQASISAEVDRFNGVAPKRARKVPTVTKADYKSKVTKLVPKDGIPPADERTTKKAKEHADIAREHGWDVKVMTNVRRGLTVIASKGDEICVLAYRENGILWNDEIQFKVPGRSVPMHNSGTWRRQVSLPEGKRPIPARPKRFGTKRPVNGTRSPESANSESTGDEIIGEAIPLNVASLPFPKDAEDAVIIDAIKGQVLYWRNNMAARVVSARVPSKARMIRFNVTKHGRRFVSFPETEFTKDGEMWGAERSVAIEDMLRVRP